jgi:hypothetical protein
VTPRKPVRVRKARRSGACPVCRRLVLAGDLIADVRGGLPSVPEPVPLYRRHQGTALSVENTATLSTPGEDDHLVNAATSAARATSAIEHASAAAEPGGRQRGEPVSDGVVYWDTGALRWLPLPGRPVPPEPDPADLVAVMFTRAEVVALFGLLQWANQRSLGLAVKGGVRDAWVRLSLAYGQSRPDIDPHVGAAPSPASTTSERNSP